jgi:hypothetical protein
VGHFKVSAIFVLDFDNEPCDWQVEESFVRENNQFKFKVRNALS